MSKKPPKLVYSTRSNAELSDAKRPAPRHSLPPQQQTIRVMLDKKKRKGKMVTVAAGFQLSPADLKALGKLLKQFCGAGGTSKDDTIEVQGNHRDKVMEKLASLGYKVKRVGG